MELSPIFFFFVGSDYRRGLSSDEIFILHSLMAPEEDKGPISGSSSKDNRQFSGFKNPTFFFLIRI